MTKNHSSSPSPRRTRLTPEQKKAVRDRYYLLRDQWCQTLESDQIDWEALFHFHFEMLQMEQIHPWLKKAVA